MTSEVADGLRGVIVAVGARETDKGASHAAGNGLQVDPRLRLAEDHAVVPASVPLQERTFVTAL